MPYVTCHTSGAICLSQTATRTVSFLPSYHERMRTGSYLISNAHVTIDAHVTINVHVTINHWPVSHKRMSNNNPVTIRNDTIQKQEKFVLVNARPCTISGGDCRRPRSRWLWRCAVERHISPLPLRHLSSRCPVAPCSSFSPVNVMSQGCCLTSSILMRVFGFCPEAAKSDPGDGGDTETPSGYSTLSLLMDLIKRDRLSPLKGTSPTTSA